MLAGAAGTGDTALLPRRFATGGGVTGMGTTDMLNKLKEQVHLLNKSLADFYAGDMIQALSIAVRARTLVHRTRSSTPLLEQVDPQYQTLEIRDKLPEETDEAEKVARSPGSVVYHCTVGIRLGTSTGFSPYVDFSSSAYTLVSLGTWWRRACLIFPYNGRHAIFSKKDLVCVLANKEGGAHVDAQLPPEYAKLLLNSPIRFYTCGHETDTVNIARYAVGQLGAELLDCLERNFPSAASH